MLLQRLSRAAAAAGTALGPVQQESQQSTSGSHGVPQRSRPLHEPFTSGQLLRFEREGFLVARSLLDPGAVQGLQQVRTWGAQAVGGLYVLHYMVCRLHAVQQ